MSYTYSSKVYHHNLLSMCMKLGFCKRNVDAGLLLVRVGLGLVFLMHGWVKLSAIEGTVGFFGTLGLHPAFAYLVAIVETLGGLLLIIGLWTHWAAKALAVVMLVAILLVKFKKGFLGGYEFELSLFLSTLGILFAGPGAYSLSNSMKKPESKQSQNKA